jgi:hypothetical protein
MRPLPRRASNRTGWQVYRAHLLMSPRGQNEIRYSSRTRASTNSFKHIQGLRHAIADLLDQLPPHLHDGPEASF